VWVVRRWILEHHNLCLHYHRMEVRISNWESPKSVALSCNVGDTVVCYFCVTLTQVFVLFIPGISPPVDNGSPYSWGSVESGLSVMEGMSLQFGNVSATCTGYMMNL